MRLYVDSAVYDIVKLFSFNYRTKSMHTVNQKSATDILETLHKYIRTSSRNRNLERTGGQVSEVNIFERLDLSPCVKEKSYLKFGRKYLPNCGKLKFSFCRK